MPAAVVTPGLDRHAELREFLHSRRARLKPEDVGLPTHGRRRVPGLRREELAQLAGVSFTYYVRLEQGYGDGISVQVLNAVARALRLTEDEHAHLIGLAQAERQSAAQVEGRQRLRPVVQHLLDALGVPAFVVGRRLDVLGRNPLAAAVFGNWTPMWPEERSLPRLFFLTPMLRERCADPGRVAAMIVGTLRVCVGKYPDDPHVAMLVGELSAKSAEFQRLWAQHDVGCGRNGRIVRMEHPLVGEFQLVPVSMVLSDDCSQRLLTFHAEPGSSSEKSLRTLADGESEPLR
ncbi:helix-turn-helix domain-containing protein [Streptomyces sp. NBC_00459]|uniref:helix-turn-helix domain-containing protein n=1 Tax=Streptomyces sp. NBC_00459 TaxID=2975749 RepID=UPI002E16C3CA